MWDANGIYGEANYGSFSLGVGPNYQLNVGAYSEAEGDIPEGLNSLGSSPFVKGTDGGGDDPDNCIFEDNPGW